jgi:hypothetical protein
LSDLNSFAELIRKGKEDKRLKDLQEAERKQKEIAPLLGDLFKSVATAKKIVEKRAAVVDKVDELEANQVTQEEIDELVSEKLEEVSSAAEKKLLDVVKKLQTDIANLKRHVDSTSRATYSGGPSGGGEVRILRMDDVVKGVTPVNGSVLTWNTSLNKFELVLPQNNGGTTTTTDEEVPYAKRIDFVSDTVLYKGEAAVGSSETSPVWRIHKVVMGSDSDVTETWANGSAAYDKRWDNRASYIYS